MKNKRKGFTLTELLVTIAIIGLLGSIGSYFIINIINNSKTKSNEIAINNIKTSVINYTKEYNDEVTWDNNQQSCVSISTLVSKGYLKDDTLKDELPKSIIITRDENLNIISEKEIYEDCNSYSKKVKIPTSKDICNTITYNGESHNLINTSIDQSNYTIKYKDNNFNTNPPINAGSYKIEANLNEGLVWQDDTTESKEVTCTIKKATPDLIILNSNGQVSTGTTDEELGTITIKVKSLDTDGTISIKSSNKNHATASIENKNITKGEEKEIKINILATRDTATYITISLTPKNNSNYKTNYIEYTIGKVTNKTVAIPTCNNLTYNASEQTLIEEKESYTLLNNKGIDYEKEYTVTAILNYGYIWSDNTLETKELKCEIKRPTPTVTYTNATCSPSTKTVTYEDKYGDLCTPSKTGYTFDGWYTNTNYTKKITSESTVTNFNNHNIYAKWIAHTYAVNYSCNGGSGSTASSSHTYDIAKKLTSNGCSRTGYTFAGWATSASGSVSYSNKQSVTNLTSTNGGIVTLYAKWTANTYTVKYNGNGNTSGSTSSSSHTYGVSKNLTANGFQKTGYTFAGWATSASGSVSYSNKQSVTNLTSTNGKTINLYAKWTPITYTVSYNCNGGGGSTSSSYHTYDTAKNLTSNGCSRTGYTFAGWATSASGSVSYSNKQSVTNLTSTNGGTVTLYAKWVDKTIPTCTVTKTTTSWSSSGVGVSVTCSDSGSGCKTGTQTGTIKADKTYTVYDNAGNKGTCSVDISSRKRYRKRTYSSCLTSSTKWKGSCVVLSPPRLKGTYSITGAASKEQCEDWCDDKGGVSGATSIACTSYKVCNGGWGSWSSYSYSSCSETSTVDCSYITQYK